jgi:rhodanese-related sulfurtransferase
MKHTKLLWFILLGFLFFAACSKDDDEETPTPINESEVLATYLESTSSPLGKDFVNTDMPTIMTAEEVHTLNLTDQVYIMDFRSAADFATGHIENAHNVTVADALTHIEGVDLTPYTKVACVCYTGQTAGYVASLLRLMGYEKVFSMKWGMASWNPFFSNKWTSSIGNTYESQFVSTATDKNAMGSLPVLSTGKTTGQEILEARVNTLLTEGFDLAKVTNQTVFGSLSTYYIVNYWPVAQYTTTGHIPGAVQYTPKESIKLAVDLKTLPTDKTIAVYCYTGQTSAYLAAYLRLLGYDAKSLMFGANGMIHDLMTTSGIPAAFIWDDSYIMDYDYVN